MSDSDTLAHANAESTTTARSPVKNSAYAQVLPIVSLCSSIFFVVIALTTFWIALFAEGRYSSPSILTVLATGLPLSLFGSVLLALLPAVILRFLVNDRRVTWAIRISGLSVIIGSIATALYLIIGYVG